MPSEMFGSPVGWSQAGKDSDAQLMNALSAAKGVGELEMQPAQKSLLESHARLYGAEADEKQMALEIRRRVAGQMNNLGQGNTGQQEQQDPADLLEKLGRLHLDAGSYDQGTKFLKEAETYRLRGAREQQAKDAAAHQATQTRIQQIEMVGAMTGAVNDQQSLERFHMQLLQQAADVKDPQQKAQIMGLIRSIPMNYDEAKPVLEQYTQQAVKAGDKLKLEIRERDQARKDEYLDLRTRLGDASIAVREAKLAADEAKAEATERNRGRASNTAETDQAAALVKQQLGVKELPEGYLVGAGNMADRARQLMRANGALTYTQALAQTYDPSDWADAGGGKAKFVAPGQSKTKAIPLTANPEMNRWYTNAAGKSKQFKGFDSAGKPKWAD